MTTARLANGGILHFPGSLITDAVNVILPPAPEALPEIAGSIAPDELLLFAKQLVAAARKRRFSDRWRLVNRCRLELARLCIARVLDGEFV